MATKNLGKIVPEKGIDYFTNEDIQSLNIPKNISELTNDSLFATEVYVKNQIANAQLGGENGEIDLSGYATKDDLHSHSNKDVLDNISSDDIAKWNAGGNVDLSNYATKDELNNKANVSAIPTKTSQLANDSGYMTSYTESDPTVPAHVKAITQNDINKWNSNTTSSGGSGLTTDQINALNEMFKVCAYVKEDVSTEYGAFKTAFGVTDSDNEDPDIPDIPDNPDDPEVVLVGVSATYTGGSVAVGTNVNSLTGITVTATYSDGSAKNVSGYELSGTIGEGENTIVVIYGGMTATFKVVGDKSSKVYLANVTTFDQYIIRKALTTNSEDGAWSVEVPYVEGMTVSGCMNSGWKNNYGIAVITSNGNQTTSINVDVQGDRLFDSLSNITQYTAKLTGYPEGSLVRINMYMGSDVNTEALAREFATTYKEYLYYSLGEV